MTEEMTNMDLYGLHMERYKKAQTIDRILQKGALAEFDKNFGIRISTLTTKIKAIQDEYLVHEINPETKKEELVYETGEDGNKKVKMKEGKTLEEFNKKSEDLMKEKVTITY